MTKITTKYKENKIVPLMTSRWKSVNTIHNVQTSPLTKHSRAKYVVTTTQQLAVHSVHRFSVPFVSSTVLTSLVRLVPRDLLGSPGLMPSHGGCHTSLPAAQHGPLLPSALDFTAVGTMFPCILRFYHLWTQD